MLTCCAHDYVHADSIRSSAVQNQEQKKKKKNNDPPKKKKQQQKLAKKQISFIMLHVHEFSNRENKFVTV